MGHGDASVPPARYKPMRQREQGVALITALLVVVLATIAAVAMSARQQVDIRRTQNMLESDQLRYYLYGVEDWAGAVLAQDRKDGDTDNLGEDWARQLPPIPVENGQIAGQVEDAQARFNVNNLLTEGKVNGVELARFRRLLAALELDPGIADAVIDWLDQNVDPTPPNGAEDNAYLSRQPAYRAANGLMADASELALVAGCDAQCYDKLAPYVIALPQPTTLNLNTTPALLLTTLSDGIDLSAAEGFVSGRDDKGYGSVDEALEQAPFTNRKIDHSGLGVASDYFVVMSDISVGRLQQRYRSLLVRAQGGATSVILRTQLYL